MYVVCPCLAVPDDDADAVVRALGVTGDLQSALEAVALAGARAAVARLAEKGRKRQAVEAMAAAGVVEIGGPRVG